MRPGMAVMLAAALLAAGCTRAGPVDRPVPADRASPSTTIDGGVAMSIAGVDCATGGGPGTGGVPAGGAVAGETCRVTLRLVDVSDGAPVFTESEQTAYDVSGRMFHPDPAADRAAGGGEPVTRRLPRMVPVSSVLVFRMPAGDRIDHLVLHGEPGTGGITLPVP